MKRVLILVASALLFAGCGNKAQDSLTQLQEGWQNPPQSARTRVWWHWMNGNITKDGIRKDIEWMNRIGLGGFQNFDAAMGGEAIVENRLAYMHDDWKDAFHYAIALADSLNLEVAIASSPGWSATGGPWVEPKDAMKKLVWRTSYVTGGQTVSLVLPEAFRTTGAFQNGAAAGRGSAAQGKDYYEDIAVLAMKLPEGYATAAELGARLSSSGGHFSLEMLSDNDIATASFLPEDAKNGSWIRWDFPQAVTIRAITLADGSGASGILECSDDGMVFTKVCDLRGGNTAQKTLSVPATTAKVFRVFYAPAPQGGPRGGMGFDMGFGMGGGRPAGPAGKNIAEMDICTYSKVNRAEDKAAFSAAGNLTAAPTLVSEGEAYSTASDVVDVTGYVKDGVLNWEAPSGKWKIFRFGFSLTGKQNHPATAEATGLEVDKLDPVAWKKFFHTYLDMYKNASRGLIGKHGIQYVLTDSYEAEHENWTPAMFEEFSKRRGYDLRGWMPVLAGEVLGSPEESDKFLWDWRKTIGELIADNYTLLSKIAREDYGMLGRYSEAHEAGRVYPVDGMDVKATAEVPMGAQWVAAPWLGRTPDGDVNRNVYVADDKESSSVAHIYGQNVAAAESMTAWGNPDYSSAPWNLKHVADLELASGINRFVIHESAHQPDDIHVPGLSLGGIGQWFNRHDTWAEMAGAWVDYMSRSSFMLSAGLNVADILWYYGEDSNATNEFGSRPPQVPAGYQWDYCSPNALLNQIVTAKGVLKSRSGTAYKVLWMDRNLDYMSLPVLRKIAQLAGEGAWIGGLKPKYPASLTDDRAEFDRLVEEIWGGSMQNVIQTQSLQEFLQKAGVSEDVDIPEGWNFLHRTIKGSEIYWVNKPSADYKDITLSFRTAGKKPQLWHPDNGSVEEVSYRVRDGRTEVELHLTPEDAVFVVFHGKGSASQQIPAAQEQTLITVSTPWQVRFQEKRGAPAEATFDTLCSYTESEDKGIKYFSGVATYITQMEVEAVPERAFLDLGEVKDIAEVYVNGEYCGTAWKLPFRVEVGKSLKEGINEVVVKVANTWSNRLIGDEQPDCAERITWVDIRDYKATDPLYPAGLLGPVRLVEMK